MKRCSTEPRLLLVPCSKYESLEKLCPRIDDNRSLPKIHHFWNLGRQTGHLQRRFQNLPLLPAISSATSGCLDRVQSIQMLFVGMLGADVIASFPTTAARDRLERTWQCLRPHTHKGIVLLKFNPQLSSGPTYFHLALPLTFIWPYHLLSSGPTAYVMPPGMADEWT